MSALAVAGLTAAGFVPAGAAEQSSAIVTAGADYLNDPVNPVATSDQSYAYGTYPLNSLTLDGTADVTGDGLVDVLEIDPPELDESLSRFVVRRGTDGQRLWGLHRNNLVSVVPLRLGQPVRPGLLVGWMVDDLTLRLEAYDGKTGRLLWQWDVPGNTASKNRAYFGAVLPSASGRAARVLVETKSRLPALARISHLYVVSGADGSSWGIGRAPHVQSPARDDFWDDEIPDNPYAQAGDIDEDGFADVLSLSLIYDLEDISGRDTRGVLTARSSTTGTTLWEREVRGAHLEVVPHTPDSSRVDVLLHRPEGLDHVSDTITALDGSTGQTRWTEQFTWPFVDRLGDADRDGIQDLLDRSSVRMVSGRTGGTLWATQLGRALVSDEPYSDVQADGVLDPTLESDGTSSGTVLINGRTGAMSTGRSLHQALGAAVDGNGDDFVQYSYAQSGSQITSVTVAIVDGLTRSTIWSWSEPDSGFEADFPLVVAAADLTGDGKAEVMVTARAQAHVTQVREAGTGAVLWTSSMPRN